MAGSLPHRRARPLKLRPRCPVVLRDDDTLQVGLQPPMAVQLPRHPDVAELLDALAAGSPDHPRTATAVAALRTLRAASLLVPADDPLPSSAAWAQFGESAGERAEQRRAHRVAISAPDHTAALAGALLEEAQLSRDDAEPTVWLLIDPGVVRRARLDPLQRAGIPHLVVSGTPQGHRVGPLVEPGLTACLRCVDAEEATDDPRLPLLVEQAARVPDVPPPDPVLERLALTYAVRDLTRWAEGDQPSTWSATVDIGPTAAPEITPRLRHPHCGCAWDALLRLA